MLKEAMEHIESLAKVAKFEYGGRNYTSRELSSVRPPRAGVIKVNTLTGLVDYILKYGSEGAFVWVTDHQSVNYLSVLHSDWQDRDKFVTATTDLYDCAFPFDSWIDQESFNIKLQSQFVKTEARDKLLQFAGTIRNESIEISEDDGVTQRGQTSAGVHLANKVDIPNPVNLQPFRTFPEIEQPESQFVFRVKNGEKSYDKGIKCALFEADGGAWKKSSILLIKEYLAKKLPDVTIVA